MAYHTIIRSENHLKRFLCNNNELNLLLNFRGVFNEAKAICISKTNNKFILLQNFMGNSYNSNDVFIDGEKIVLSSEDTQKYRRLQIVFFNEVTNFFNSIFYLHKEFNDAYTLFIQQNNKLLKNIWENYTTTNDPNIKYLFLISNGSPNTVHWGANSFFKYNVPFGLLKNCIKWCQKYPQLVKQLEKGSLTSYKGSDNIISAYAEMVHLRKIKRVNDVINMFGSTQKKLLRSVELTDKVITMFSKFKLVSRMKQHNFIRKMSSVENVNDILSQMALLVKTHFTWDKDSLLSYINANDDLKCTVVYDNNNRLVVLVKDYDTIKFLAKTTNWCISKNKSYWNNYMNGKFGGARQFILFDFNQNEDSELSIIGFTVNNGEITNAHSFSNNNLMSEDRRNIIFIPEDVKYFIQNNKDINAILENLNIPKSTYTKLADCRYTWDRDYFYANFIEHLDTNDYDILKEDNNQLVVIYYNSALLNTILYNKYKSAVAASDKVIVFVDFSKSNADKEKCVFVFTKHNDTRTLDYVYCILDGHGNKCDIDGLFGRLVNYYNLPLDIIKRPCSFYNELNEAISGCDINKLKKLLSEKDVFLKKINELNYNERNELICSIDASILSYHTLSVLEVFYDNGISLLNICPTEILINNVIVRLLYDILACRLSIVPSETDFNNLYTSNNDYRVSRYLGVMLALNKILNMEKIVVTSEVVSILEDFMDNKYLFIYMLKLFHDKIPPKGLSRLISNANERFATTDFTLMFAKTSPC